MGKTRKNQPGYVEAVNAAGKKYWKPVDPVRDQSHNTDAPKSDFPEQEFDDRSYELMQGLSKLVDPTIDFNPFSHEESTLKEISEQNIEWTEKEKEALEVLDEIAEVTYDRIDSDSILETQELIDSMPKWNSRSINSFPISYRSGDRLMAFNDAAKQLLNYQKRSLKENDIVPERERNQHLLGLEETQKAFFSKRNNEYVEEGKTNFGADAEQQLNEAVNTVVSEGPRQYEFNEYEFNSKGQVIQELSGRQESYLALVFPDKELKKSMDAVDLGPVSVTSFNNSRENGLVYTTVQPDGVTRSFSVYEHRNSDSIIINGQTGWDGNGLPYAADSKNAFFAEYANESYTGAAQALTFFLSQAQKGELPDDDTLVRQAPRVDWYTKLSETLPGFKEFADKHYPDMGARYSGDSDEDVLRRLDFDN